MLPPDARPEGQGRRITSQGADDSLGASFPVAGQGRLDQRPPHPSAARLRGHEHVEATPHTPAHPAGVEAHRPAVSVRDEQDPGRVTESPREEPVEVVEVGGRGLGVAVTALLQPHLGPQHGQREQVSILGGPNDDRVRILAHTA